MFAVELDLERQAAVRIIDVIIDFCGPNWRRRPSRSWRNSG